MFKVGDRVRIIRVGNDPTNPLRSGHSFLMNHVYTIGRVDNSRNDFQRLYMNGDPLGMYCTNSEVELVAQTAEELTKKADSVRNVIKKYHELLSQVEAQIEWMTETKAETFDPETYRIYKILGMFEQANVPKEQKVKMLKSLLNPELEPKVTDIYGSEEPLPF